MVRVSAHRFYSVLCVYSLTWNCPLNYQKCHCKEWTQSFHWHYLVAWKLVEPEPTIILCGSYLNQWPLWDPKQRQFGFQQMKKCSLLQLRELCSALENRCVLNAIHILCELTNLFSDVQSFIHYSQSNNVNGIEQLACHCLWFLVLYRRELTEHSRMHPYHGVCIGSLQSVTP